MLNTSETPFHANEKWIKAANINERIFNIETPSVGSLSLAVNIDNVRIISVSTVSRKRYCSMEIRELYFLTDVQKMQLQCGKKFLMSAIIRR